MSKPHLTPDEQLDVCQKLAHFWKPLAIKTHIQKTYGKHLAVETIVVNYRESTNWRPVIDKFREQYISDLSAVPLFHKRKRLDELTFFYEFYKDRKKYREARLVLGQIMEEVEGKAGEVSFSFTQINNNQFNKLTDEELKQEKLKTMAELEKVKKMKELIHEREATHGLGRKDAQES